MEMRIGKSLVIINPCEATEEEQERAEYELHMVLYKIMDQMIERGEAVEGKNYITITGGMDEEETGDKLH